MKDQYSQVRVGLIGLGLSDYWDQFEGLKTRLLGYLAEVERKLTADTRVIVNLGLVDTPEKALDAGHACRCNDIDLLLVYVTTYALSSTILPVILRARVPVILLNLQPADVMDYSAFNRLPSRTAMTGEWLAWCNSCPVPEIANVLKRLDLPFHQVTGTLQNDPTCWLEVEQWLRASETVHALAHSRFGLMGHYYGGMLDVATDLTQVSGRFGLHLEMIEVDELAGLRRNVALEEVQQKLGSFRTFFQLDSDCPNAELERAARTSVALDQLVARKDLDLMAYYHRGTGVSENEEVMSSIILGASMLTGSGVPIAGEYEVKNAIAMKIMDLLGAGGSFTEYYAIDFAANLVLMGHDGPGHNGIAQDRIRVRPLHVYHGKVGRGLSVEMSVRQGPVTLLAILEHPQYGFSFLVAEGSCVAGEILEIGNTNSRYSFPPGARKFVETWNSYGPAHHCAIGIGHTAAQLEKISQLLQLGFHQVC